MFIQRSEGKALIVSAALFIALGLSGAAISVVSSQSSMSHPGSSDPQLHAALAKALKTVEELRRRDRSTRLECTQYFSDFNRYPNIEPYISFFKSIDIPVISIDINLRHFDYFELNYRQLWSLGYKGFALKDRLVISFTKMSASSDEIIGFNVTLLNDTIL
jgi:hypothetical protein